MITKADEADGFLFYPAAPGGGGQDWGGDS